jgi:hypothetical protein
MESKKVNIHKHILKKYNIKTDVIEIPNVTRDDLAELFHELDFKVGVEVGVAAGDYSAVILRANPQLSDMYGVDPFQPYRGYKDFVKLGTFDSLEKKAENLLGGFTNYKFIKEFSVDAVKHFEDNSLDFVYIDGNHAEPYVSQDIEMWTKKVRKGGIVSGHDYARIKGTGGEDSTNWVVIQAINKYAKENNHQLYIWGLEAKLPGLKRDGSRSWMFVK